MSYIDESKLHVSLSMPTKPGYYWFVGVLDSDLKWERIIGIGEIVDWLPGHFFMRSRVYNETQISGKYYGPLQPPWENGNEQST